MPSSSRRTKRSKFHPRTPQLRRHSRGRAIVTLSGETHFLGAWPPDAAAHRAYAELLEQWEANGRQPIKSVVETCASAQRDAERLAERLGVTVDQAERVRVLAIEMSLSHAEALALARVRHVDLFEPQEPVASVRDALADYEAHIDGIGKYTKGGARTTERSLIDRVVREFVEQYGDVPVSELGKRHLVGYRRWLEVDNPHLTVSGIRRKTATIKRALAWLYEGEVLTPEQWLAVDSVRQLRRSDLPERDVRKPKREVTLEEAEAVAENAGRVIGAMVLTQALTACRPGEVVAMKHGDIDRTPVVGPDGVSYWTWHLRTHKTSHHDPEARTIPLGPRAQQILGQFRGFGAAFVFQPRDMVADRRREQRERRKTPVQPSQQARDRRPKRPVAAQFDTDLYNRCVLRAIARTKGVARFTVHQLRHGALSRIARTEGPLAAQAIAGHKHLTTTQGYVHHARDDALRAAACLDGAQVG